MTKLPFIVQDRIDKNEPFDLYFVGTQSPKLNDWFIEQKCCRLFTQLERGSLKKWYEIPQETGKLFVDSGAHSAHTRGVALDVDEYIEYVNMHDSDIYVFAQVDKIPGVYLQPKTIEDWVTAPAQSWENYLYMRDKCISPDKIMPVFHQGENFKWLSNMLEAKFENDAQVPYIGLSPRGDVSVNSKIDFLDKCFSVIQNSSNPNVKTHALGMTSLNVMEMFPLYSADSTTYLRVGAYGNVMTPWGLVYVSDFNLAAEKHIRNRSKYDQDVFNDFLKKYGYTLEEVETDYLARMMCNAMYMKDWADNYTYTGRPSQKKRLF